MGERVVVVLVTFFALSTCGIAQWTNHSDRGTPRLKDGKPNLSAPAPRMPDGKPELTGIWQADSSPIPELLSLLPGGSNGLGEDIPSKYFLDILADFKPGEAPLLPATAALYRQRLGQIGQFSPATRCLPTGVPLVNAAPAPYKIVQTPGVVVMLYEADTSFRQIHLDGRKHPEDPQPAWLGYSTGRWENDSLVVDTKGFNDKSWLDAMGHPHSDAMRVVERFHRRDFGHIDVQITVDDPRTYTKPFTIKLTQHLLPDTDLIEYFCMENERDVSHLPGK
jgi:hypothetical protein